MITLLAGLALIFIALAARSRQPVSVRVDDLAAARVVAAARLHQIQQERAERFRAYDRAWATARGKTDGRRYVLPFAQGGSR